MEITQARFCELFADQLNKLDLAFSVLRSGLENGYGGKVEFDIDHSNAAFTSAHLHVSAECALTWGNGWSDWSADGRIDWTTTSGHTVRFDFDRAQYGEVNLLRVVAGDDESESFYPLLARTCAQAGIECNITPAIEL